MKNIKIKIVESGERPKIKNGRYVYGIRHSDDDWGMPVTVESYVLVNRYGYIVSNQPLNKIINDNNKCYNLSDEEREIIIRRTNTGWFYAAELFDCYDEDN